VDSIVFVQIALCHKNENTMEKKRRSFHGIKTLILIILCLTISSCHGQVDSKSKEEKHESLTSNSTEAKNIEDPLFYIDGQLCQHLREIFQDSKGNLWFGTNVYDLMMYNGDILKYISKKEGFNGGRVTGIVEDSIGDIWFATSSGLYKYDGESFVVFNEENGLLNNEIWSLYLDSKGIFWIGHNDGLSRFDGKVFENIVVPKPEVQEPKTIYSADRITGIVEDKEGNLWLGTDGYGICKYDGENFTHFTIKNGLCDNTIYELMVDSNNNIWIGTFWGGVSKFDGKEFTNFTKNKVIIGDEVGGFFEDDNGDIWFGVENNVVYKYDGTSFSHYYKEEGLDASILSIYKDKESRFWFGGWGGLFRYDGKFFTSVTKDGPWE